VTAAALAVPRRAASLVVPALVCGVGLVTLAALTAENPLGAVAVPLAAISAWVLWRLPLKVSVMGLLFCVVFFEGLQATLVADYEVPVLSQIAKMLMYNVSTLTGVTPLRAPLLDIVTVVLFALSSVRRDESWCSRKLMVRPLNTALWLMAAAIGVLFIIGQFNGGDFAESLWQMRHLLLFPIRTALLMRAFDGTKAELYAVSRVLVVAATLKALLGMWIAWGVASPAGLVAPYTTSHTDTLLFVPVLALAFSMFVERGFTAAVRSCGLWVPIVVWGMVLNDRRIAYVSLGAAMVAIVMMARPTPARAQLARFGLVATPLYFLIGWNTAGTGFFHIVGVIKSLIYGERGDILPDYREIENADVLYTWSRHKILPAGFGHKFDIFFPIPDISNWFSSWRYHPHNSYLWLFTLCGPIGVAAIMAPFVITLFLAGRVYRAASDPVHRVAALAAIATVIAVLNQAWGDMGTLSFTVIWMGALAAAFMSKLAIRTGGWPVVFSLQGSNR
jgi:hypothetical protein